MDEPPIRTFWWLKRLLPVAVALPVAWLGFHIWLGNHIDAREAALLDEWRQDGWPHPDETVVNQGVVPQDPRNAAFPLNTAASALPPLSPEDEDWEADELRGSPFRVDADGLTHLRSIVETTQLQLDLARQAREIEEPIFDWGLPAVQISTLMPLLNSFREIANRLGYLAAVEHAEGDLLGATEAIRDMLRLSDATPTYGPSLVSGLVSCGIEALAAARAADLATTPIPGLDDADRHERWRAARPAVEALIADLLADANEPMHDAAFAYRGERTMSAAAPQFVGLPAGGVSGWVAKPFFKADLLRTAAFISAMGDAAAESNDLRGWIDLIARSRDDFGFEVEPESSAEMLSELMSSILLPSLDRGTEAFTRVEAQRRMAAVALSVRLYRVDHDGALPSDLDALVPEYLPFVPGDPMASESPPLRYRLGGPLPVVYSVGVNGQDDGGRMVRPGGNPQRSWEHLDLAQPLTPAPDPRAEPDEFVIEMESQESP
ncbi:MAG: hypothetical protein AAGI46_00735 [Planctomycetota bacterium]